MEIGYVTANELNVCGSLFLPEVTKMIAEGQPLIALAVSQENVAIGGVAGYLDEGLFRISSLYVSPKWRRMGAGRLLVDTLKELLDEEVDDSGMIIDFTVTEEEHETLLPFLEAMGFSGEVDEEENFYLFTLRDLEESPFFKGAKGSGTSFAQIDEDVLHRADREAIGQSSPRPECGLDGGDVDRDCSVALVKGREVTGYVAFDHSCMGRLTLAAAWVKSTEAPGALPGLLRAAFVRTDRKYPSETDMAIQTVNESSASLVRRLIPTAKPIAYTCYYCDEEE